LTVQEHITSGTDSVDKEDVYAFLSHSLAGIPNLERERMMEAIADYQTAKVPVDLLSFSIPHANEFFKKNSTGLEALVSLEKVIAALYEWRLKTEHLHLIESSLLIRIAKVLTVLNDSLQEYRPDISVSLAISFIRKAMTGIAAPIEAAPLEGEPLDAIQVMGMLESRCLDFDEVVILGANEGVLPQLSLSPTFIPDSLRRAFGLPVIENQDALSAYLFYRLLQRSKKVSVV